MTTYATYTGSGSGFPAKRSGVYRITGEVDFSTINSGSGTVQNDVIQALYIPAGTFVLGVGHKVTTASSNLDDFDIGDDATTDGYVDGDTAVTADTAMNFSFDTDGTMTEAFGNGKFYATANTIDIKQNTNATVVTGVIKLAALAIDVNVYE